MDFTLEDWEELDLDLDQRDLFWDLLLVSKHHLDPSHCFLPVTHRTLSSDAQCTGQHLVTEAPPALSTDSAGPQEPALVPAGFLHPLPFLLVTGAFPWAAGSGGRGCRPLCPHSSALTHPPVAPTWSHWPCPLERELVGQRPVICVFIHCLMSTGKLGKSVVGLSLPRAGKQ